MIDGVLRDQLDREIAQCKTFDDLCFSLKKHGIDLDSVDSMKEEIRNLENEVTDLEDEICSCERQIEELESDNSQLEERISEMEEGEE